MMISPITKKVVDISFKERGPRKIVSVSLASKTIHFDSDLDLKSGQFDALAEAATACKE
jgi:hypothetical protein